jgi:SnoaL-like domain
MSPRSPRDIAAAYFTAIRARDVEGIKQVFAPGGELVTPTGTYVGPDGIADFYAGQAFTVPDLQPQTGPFVIDGNRVAVEIVLQMHGQKSRVADFFEICDGLIQRLTIYLGGAA